jgi:hypothetical protein
MVDTVEWLCAVELGSQPVRTPLPESEIHRKEPGLLLMLQDPRRKIIVDEMQGWRATQRVGFNDLLIVRSSEHPYFVNHGLHMQSPLPANLRLSAFIWLARIS